MGWGYSKSVYKIFIVSTSALFVLPLKHACGDTRMLCTRVCVSLSATDPSLTGAKLIVISECERVSLMCKWVFFEIMRNIRDFPNVRLFK